MSIKLCVSSYSYNKLNLPLDKILDKVKEMGFRYVEIVDLYRGLPIMKKSYYKKIKEHIDELELTLTSFTFDAELLNKPSQKEIKRIKSQIDIAKMLGAKYIRHDLTQGPKSGFNRSDDEILPMLAEMAREITEYGQSLGIITMVENHGQYFENIDRIEKTVNLINHPNFKLLGDMGNFMCGDENSSEGFDRLAKHMAYVHAKDFIYFDKSEGSGEGCFETVNGHYLKPTIIGRGDVDIKHCVEALKNVNYDGFICIEFEGPEDVVTAINESAAHLRRVLEN